MLALIIFFKYPGGNYGDVQYNASQLNGANDIKIYPGICAHDF